MNPLIPAAEDDSIAAALAAIWQRARPTVLARLEAVEKAAVALSSGTLSAEERANAERESHKLAGIAGTLGFPKVTIYAREAETLLEGTAALNAPQITRLNELVMLSRAEFDDAVRLANTRVALFSFEEGLVASLQAMASRHHIDIAEQSKETAATPLGAGDSYDVCVVHVGPQPGGIDVVTHVRERHPDTPVIVWTDDESLAHCAACVRAGAKRVVSGAAAAVALIHAIHSMVPKLGGRRVVVLASGIEPGLSADLLTSMRASNGLFIEVETTEILAVLKAVPTPVLLIGADGEGTDALDVCRVVRADARGVGLSIMLVTTADSHIGAEAHTVGAIEINGATATDVMARIKPFLGNANARVGAHDETKKKADGAAPSASEHVDVAVVEDDELVTLMIEDALSASGHSYRVIRDGVSASAALAGRAAPLTATVILLDLGLPGQDGFGVLRSLRQTGVTKTSSVVVLTARSEQAEVVQALQLGAAAYVVKPFVIDDLMQRVRGVLAARG